MAKVLCLDFDDTIVLDNTARQIFERFAGPGWREREDEYHRGERSVEQFNMAAMDLVEATRAEIVEFASAMARVRPGFVSLCDWASWNGWAPVVVSNGFDVYVDTILDGLGLDRLARHVGRARHEYRWRIRYCSPRGIELQEGFKVAYVHAFRESGDFVAYVGDGRSDVEAAQGASAVFARSTLLEELHGRERVYPFETFDDVVEVLDREGERWVQSLETPQ